VIKLFCDYCEKEIRNSDDNEYQSEFVLQIVENPNGSMTAGTLNHKKHLLDMDLCKGCTRKFLRLLVEVSGGELDNVTVGGKKVK